MAIKKPLNLTLKVSKKEIIDFNNDLFDLEMADEAEKKLLAFNDKNFAKRTSLQYKTPDVVYELGDLVGVIYNLNGQKYIHTFKQASQPVLASSHDGKQLYILGGGYKITERGIIDTANLKPKRTR